MTVETPLLREQRRPTLTQAAGIAAILVPILLLPWFTFPRLARWLDMPMPQSSAQVDWARWRVENTVIVSAVDWSVILAILLEFVAVVGFFYVLRRAGAFTWVGLVFWLVGLQLVLLEHVAYLVITESLSPRYLPLPEAARPGMENVIYGVWRLAVSCAALGNKLVLGVALPILAAAGLRLAEIPKWVGWGGIFIAILYWIPIRYWPHPAFIGFLLWLCVMGVVLLRLKEQATSH